MKINNFLLLFSLLVPFHQANAQGFAVIELFASEGCSSCPPADDVLRDIVKEAKENDLPIYALSFQVDYWNYLGWKDPYSDSAYTNRQYLYQSKLRLPSVYTPQMIINGKKECVGSNVVMIQRFIDQALGSAFNDPGLNISVHNKQNSVDVQFTLDSDLKNAIINAAIVEDGLVSNVNAGENEGRVLRHDHVVRGFVTKPLTNRRGIITLAKPQGIVEPNITVVIYLQDITSFNVVAANAKSLK